VRRRIVRKKAEWLALWMVVLAAVSALGQGAATNVSWWVPQAGVGKGAVKEYRVESHIYGRSRKVTVYTPAGYSATGEPYDVAYFFDADDYLGDIGLPVVMENLIAAKKMKPMVVVLVDNSEDRLGDLANHKKFADFMANEVVPWATKNVNVTGESRRTIIGGYSAGGLASAYVAFMHPEAFGNVLSQSGAFWRGNEGASEPYEWLTGQIAASPKKDVRFYLEVGGAETRRALGSGPVFIEAVRRMRDALQAKGYSLTYKEVPGAQHEPTHWRGALGEALIAVSSAR
jgi:enterochelin esterase-like enzyme